MVMKKFLVDLFYPKNVAIIGSVEKGGWLERVKQFKGKVYGVKISIKEKLIGNGIEWYHSILDIPGEVDYAILSVPADSVKDVLSECIEKRVKVVCIFSSGFSESGDDGKMREKELYDLARNGETKVIGPNCIGLHNGEIGISLSYRDEEELGKGNIAFISQSGGITENFFTVSETYGIKFGKGVSFGNACLLDFHDFLDCFSDDEDTEIIAGYIEGIKDGRKLMDSLKNTTPKKPVIIWKAGRSEAASRAAGSHTGALTGSKEVWETVFTQYNVVEAKSFKELLELVMSFDKLPPSKGKNVFLMSISGGMGVELTDSFSEVGFCVPELSRDVQERISRGVESVGTSVKNPIDLAMSWVYPGVIKNIISVIEEDTSIDLVVLHIDLHRETWMGRYIASDEHTMMDVLKDDIFDAHEKIRKPLALILSPTSEEELKINLKKEFLGENIPVYDDPFSAAKAIKKVVNYREISNLL